MAETSEPKSYQVLRIEDLPMHDDVRQQFERRSQEIKEGAAVRPTEVGLADPSKSLSRYCAKCGVSHSEPFGPHSSASKLQNQYGNTVENYPCGGIIIYSEHDMVVSIEKSSGLGSSGQLGFTRIVLTPKK